MRCPQPIAVFFALSSALGASLLTGCAGMTTTSSPDALPGVTFNGSVHGGQQPVTGAHVYLFAAGTSGYGSASASLLGTGISGVLLTDPTGTYTTTNSSGSFGITGYYTCPTPTTQVYLLATGGNPGLASGTNNTAISLIAAIGSCSNLTPSTFINIDEVSTAAAVTALQQFMSSPTAIGTSSTNSVGLQNAFLSVTNLADLGTGFARSAPAGGTGVSPAPS